MKTWLDKGNLIILAQVDIDDYSVSNYILCSSTEFKGLNGRSNFDCLEAARLQVYQGLRKMRMIRLG